MRVRRVEEPVRKPSAEVEDHGVVISVAVVVSIGDRTEAGVQPGRSPAVVYHQVVGKGVDVHSVRHVAGHIARANEIVTVRTSVTNASHQVLRKTTLHRCRPDCSLRRFNVWIDTADPEVQARDSSLAIKTCGKTGSRKAERRLVAVAKAEYERVGNAWNAVGQEGRLHGSRRIAAEFFLN